MVGMNSNDIGRWAHINVKLHFFKWAVYLKENKN